MSDAMMSSFGAADSWLEEIAEQEDDHALRYLQTAGQATLAGLTTLTETALARVEVDLARAARWLAIAALLYDQLNQEAQPPDAVALRRGAAQLAYARARLAVHRGELSVAEDELRAAQEAWQQANDANSSARCLLGLTQIYAMQGRYAEAEAVARQAVTQLTIAESVTEFARVVDQAGAHHNLATLLTYTERHAAALVEYDTSRQLLQRVDPAQCTPDEITVLTLKLAHSELNRASALTFLDQPDAAEAALRQAIVYFERVGDLPDRGRAQTNLGRLYLRTGRYAAALTAFDRAVTDLIGDLAIETNAPLADLRQADELLLEQAMAYLVLNLLPEAEQALARSEELFRSAEQPYELGQTLYTWGYCDCVPAIGVRRNRYWPRLLSVLRRFKICFGLIAHTLPRLPLPTERVIAPQPYNCWMIC
ncbi:MAG: tetratricopeptide repeat protein [Caldilineaceae bacterium]